MQAFGKAGTTASQALHLAGEILASEQGAMPGGQALYFTGAKLQRLTELRVKLLQAQRKAELRIVLIRSLISRASLLENQGQLQEASDFLVQAQEQGADVSSMQQALHDKMAAS